MDATTFDPPQDSGDGKRLAPMRLGRGSIKARDVWAAHARFADAGGLADNVGDGYLYATNPIFRVVRDETRARGYRFTHDDFEGYFSFPLMSLERLIAAQVIPYRSNAVWLERLADHPSFDLENLRRSCLCENYLFHESAHGIVHTLLNGAADPARLPRDHDMLLKTQLAEACCIATEALAWTLVTGELGQYFLAMNTAFNPGASGVGALVWSGQTFGFEATIKTLVYSLLYAGFLYTRADEPERRAVASWAGLDPREALRAPAFDAVVALGFKPAEDFRAESAVLYLAQYGYRPEVLAALGADPAPFVTDHVRCAVDAFAALLAPSLTEAFSTA